jgi:ribonuclease HI
MMIMKTETELPTLERLLDPLTNCFSREGAQRILSLRIDSAAQAKLDEFAARNKEGRLTSQERAEYESCVRALDLIALLQAKAKRLDSDSQAMVRIVA